MGERCIMEENVRTISQRYFELLYRQLAMQLPQPSNPIHIYSTGAMIKGFKAYRTNEGYQFVISEGIDYGLSALGYNEDGTQMPIPSKGLRRINYKIVDRAIDSIAMIVAKKGGIIVNGIKLY